jgi:thiol-disulfide isomerase/thioredoxin
MPLLRTYKMGIINCFLALVAVSLGVIPALAAGPGSLVVDAGALAGLQFSAPKKAAAKGYLGLKDSDAFTLPQIKADTVIIEVFSMYCPICQAEAPVVNELHQLIEKTPSLKGKVKLIGIGAGNSAFEVEVFRKKYNILFPLFPDEKFGIQKALSGPIRTPTFIAVKGYGRKTLKVRYVHVGKIDPKQFLKAATAASRRRK